MAKRKVNLEFNQQGLAELNRTLSGLQKTVDGNKASLRSLSNSLGSVTTLFGNLQKAALAFSGVGLIKVLADYNKGFFELSRNSKILSQNFHAMQKAMSDVHKTTTLNLRETQAFFSTMQRGQVGIRLNAKATGQLAKVLTREYGPSLEDIKGAMSDLLSLQQKEVNVLKRLNQGFKPGELVAYGSALMNILGASEKEVDTLVRVATAGRDARKMYSQQEKDWRRQADAMQKVEKAAADATMNALRPMASVFESLAGKVTDALNQLNAFAKHPIGKMVLGAGAIGVAGAGILGGASAVGQTLGGIRDFYTGAKGRIGGFLQKRGRGRLRVPRGGGGGAGLSTALAGALGGAGVVDVRVVNFLGRTAAAAAGGGATVVGGGGEGGKKAARGGKATKLRGGRMGTALGTLGAFGTKASSFVSKATPWALLASMIADFGGEALKSTGHEKIGSGLQAGGGIAGMAGTGALLGSFAPGPGNVIGAIIGAGIGLYTQWDNLETATQGLFGAEEKAKDAIEERTQKEKDLAKAVAGRSGVNVEDKEKLLAAATMEILAKTVAKEQAQAKGLGAQASQEYVSRTMADYAENRIAPQFAAAFREAFSDVVKSGDAEIAARIKLGKQVKDVSSPAAQAEMEGIMEQKRYTAMKQLNREAELRHKITEETVKAHETLANYAAKYMGDIQGSIVHHKIAAKQILKQKDEYQRIVSLLEKVQSGVEITRQEEKEILAIMEREGKSEEDARQTLVKRELLAADLAKRKAQVRTYDMQAADQQGKIIEKLGIRTSLSEQETGVLESQLGLIRAQYLGMGPYLDQIFKVDEARSRITHNLQSELKAVQTLLKEQPDNLQYLQKELDIKRKIFDNETKRLEITKNLREGYLDAVQAFTNVEGSFSKLIMNRETGFGELLRRGMAEAGYKVGALGTGSSQALLRYRPGGGMEFRQAQEQLRLMKGMEAVSRFWPQTIGTAALEQEAGASDILHGATVKRATGGAMSQVGYLTPKAQEEFMRGYVPTNRNDLSDQVRKGTESSKNISLQSEHTKSLDNNMSEYVRIGVDKSKLIKIMEGCGCRVGVFKSDTDKKATVKSEVEKKLGQVVGSESRVAQAEEEKKRKQRVQETIQRWKAEAQGKTPEAIEKRWKAEAVEKNKKWNRYISTTPWNATGINTEYGKIGSRSGRAPIPKSVEENKLFNAKTIDAETLSGPQKILHRLATGMSYPEAQKQQDPLIRRVFTRINLLLQADAGFKADQASAEETRKKQAEIANQLLRDSLNVQNEQLESGKKANKGLEAGKSRQFGTLADIKMGDMAKGGRPVETGFSFLEKSVLGGASDTGWVKIGFSSGGPVPGSGTGDSVPALLAPGEFVMNPKATKANYGLLNALNKNRYADGGLVSPSPAITMGGAGGFSPRIGISVRGDSVNMIMKSVTSQLQKRLNDMMAPAGTSSRYFDIPQSG